MKTLFFAQVRKTLLASAVLLVCGGVAQAQSSAWTPQVIEQVYADLQTGNGAIMHIPPQIAKTFLCKDNLGLLRIGRGLSGADCNGKAAIMNYDLAIVACPAGTFLPTARQLARWAVQQGARPIREQTGRDREFLDNHTDGYGQIRAKNADGKVDTFFSDRPFHETSMDPRGSRYSPPPQYTEGLLPQSPYLQVLLSASKNHIPDESRYNLEGPAMHGRQIVMNVKTGQLFANIESGGNVVCFTRQ